MSAQRPDAIQRSTAGRVGHPLGVYRRDSDGYRVELKLREARQLFNTLDPAPFHEKDLDPSAEEYLVSAVREIGARPSKLVLLLPAEEAEREDWMLQIAIRNYFSYRARHADEQLRLLLRRGAISFAIGLAFLFVCLTIRRLVEALGPSFASAVVDEGLLILGWVAMWRPVEIFLYDWWPELGKRQLFARIATMPIEVQVDAGLQDENHR
jgi:hypothetical protein